MSGYKAEHYYKCDNCGRSRYKTQQHACLITCDRYRADLDRAVADARKQALEEAADLMWKLYPGANAAARIRALATPPGTTTKESET